ncbi:hypothetical protein ACD591_16080 [Rufibacter glacialis]|uniref:Uncharacterized protein n=1 Tax=Rufibacter glacialis TaxID=1259555 RepID=A0A5M8QS99_9BACT|nr:hypothetical protein [Rufibacter glacialis]KAA6437536.1 hypothetical protein FOE74_03260 [Rufibacter glacialis]
MKPRHYIQRNWRLLCTSIALLLVLTVNHRALPAYAHVTASPAERAAVSKKGLDAESSVVKQKISFEATTSFIALEIAEPAALPRLTFLAPIQQDLESALTFPYWASYLQQLALLAISPNAP